MYFILPDEGVSPETLIANGEVFEFITNPHGHSEKSMRTINFKIPKFDVSSSVSLIEKLETIGVTDIFDPEKADLSAMTDIPSFVSRVDHSARVKIDEKGCEAAAYTVIAADAMGTPPGEEVNFYLDRPFIFVVTSPINTPLFIGIVNNP